MSERPSAYRCGNVYHVVFRSGNLMIDGQQGEHVPRYGAGNPCHPLPGGAVILPIRKRDKKDPE